MGLFKPLSVRQSRIDLTFLVALVLVTIPIVIYTQARF